MSIIDGPALQSLCDGLLDLITLGSVQQIAHMCAASYNELQLQ